MLQQPAEACVTDNLAVRRFATFRFRPIAGQRFVVQRLMWADGLIIVDVFGDQVVEVVFPEHDEVVQGFLLDTLNPPFHESVHVGCSRTHFFHFRAGVFDDAVKIVDEHVVHVVNQLLALVAGCVHVLNERLRLLFHPSRIRLAGALRDEDRTAADVNECEDEVLT